MKIKEIKANEDYINSLDRLKNKNDKIRADIAEIVDYANTKIELQLLFQRILY